MRRCGLRLPAALLGVLAAGTGAPFADAGGKSDRLDTTALAAELRRIVEITPTSAPLPASYGFDEFAGHVTMIPLETAAVVGATLALGFADWDWGSASFHFQSEGFFGRNTTNGGMDKLGHAFGSAVLADFFTDSISRHTPDREGAALTGSLMSFGVMTMVEIFDGFATTHGFAYEDMVMNAAGVTFAYFRNTVPGLDEKIDFRLEYVPSGNRSESFKPHSDYSGQKYVLALKLSGFEGLRDTPLRFVELHAGYFVQGFTREEKLDGISKSREPYVAVGLNLQELFFGRRQPDEPFLKNLGREFFEHAQVPFTYATYNTRAYRY